MTRRDMALSGDMSDEGAQIRARRTRLGIDKKALAEESGVARETLAAIEAGKGFRASTLGKIQRTLDAIEAEAGVSDQALVARPIGNPEDDLVEFIVEGNFGVRAVVKGPVRDMDAMQAAVSKLIAGMQVDESNTRAVP